MPGYGGQGAYGPDAGAQDCGCCRAGCGDMEETGGGLACEGGGILSPHFYQSFIFRCHIIKPICQRN